MSLTRVPEIHTGMLRDDTRFVCLVGTEDACGEARVQGVDHRRMVRPTNTAQPRPSTRCGFVGCVQDPQRFSVYARPSSTAHAKERTRWISDCSERDPRWDVPIQREVRPGQYRGRFRVDHSHAR